MLQRMDRLDAVVSEKHGGNFGLKKVERTGNNVLTLEDLAIGYGDKRLASGINLSLHRGEALGIIGGNGTGKTTLLKSILGEIPALSGEIRWGTKTNFGYYAQNLEELEPRNEVIQELRRVAPSADNGELRSFLARFLFMGEDVFKLVGDLSGGEKGRLALAKLIYSRKNVLILDEPTNHLDIPAREALESALAEYDGTIVTVSHDRFFLDKIATQILAFEGDRVEVSNGNYSDFHDLERIPERQSPEPAEEKVTNATPAAMSARANGGLSKNQRERIEYRISEIELSIGGLEQTLSELGAKLSTPNIAADFNRTADLTSKIEGTQSQIDGLYAEWDDLASQL